jgi:WD40 repeat protein
MRFAKLAVCITLILAFSAFRYAALAQTTTTRLVAISGDYSRFAVIGRVIPHANGTNTFAIDVFDTNTLGIVGTVEARTNVDLVELNGNGTRLTYSIEYGELVTVNVDGTNPINVLQGPVSTFEVNKIDWSPTSNQFLYTLGAGIDIVNGATGAWTATVVDNISRGLPTDIEWNPSGITFASSMYARADSIWSTPDKIE